MTSRITPSTASVALSRDASEVGTGGRVAVEHADPAIETINVSAAQTRATSDAGEGTGTRPSCYFTNVRPYASVTTTWTGTTLCAPYRSMTIISPGRTRTRIVLTLGVQFSHGWWTPVS